MNTVKEVEQVPATATAGFDRQSWSAAIPSSLGLQVRLLDNLALELAAGYAYRLRAGLDGVTIDKGNGGFWSTGIGLVIGERDRDGDGLTDHEESRQYFTNPAMTDGAVPCSRIPLRPGSLSDWRFSVDAGGPGISASGSSSPTQHSWPDAIAAGVFRQRRQRRTAVPDHVVGHGIASKRLITEALGEKDLIAPNDTSVGRAVNRRAELIPQ